MYLVDKLSEEKAESSEVERELITMRYFQDKTQNQIAKQLGISQVQVSRLEKKILRNMRNAIDRKSN